MKVEVCKAGRVDVIRFGKDLRLWCICTALLQKREERKVTLFAFFAKMSDSGR